MCARGALLILAGLAVACAGAGRDESAPVTDSAASMSSNDNAEPAQAPMPIDQARAELIGTLRELPGLTMIGVGERDGAPCLRVYVVSISEEVRQRVPSSLGGWPVELRESGPVRARS